LKQKMIPDGGKIASLHKGVPKKGKNELGKNKARHLRFEESRPGGKGVRMGRGHARTRLKRLKISGGERGRKRSSERND